VGTGGWGSSELKCGAITAWCQPPALGWLPARLLGYRLEISTCTTYAAHCKKGVKAAVPPAAVSAWLLQQVHEGGPAGLGQLLIYQGS
jgi:hypothetical protein